VFFFCSLLLLLVWWSSYSCFNDNGFRPFVISEEYVRIPIFFFLLLFLIDRSIGCARAFMSEWRGRGEILRKRRVFAIFFFLPLSGCLGWDSGTLGSQLVSLSIISLKQKNIALSPSESPPCHHHLSRLKKSGKIERACAWASKERERVRENNFL